jgi:hypothetical protein
MPEVFSNLPHVADHVIAVQHQGETATENLALCCPFCNQHKGPNVGGIDAQAKEFVRLFHPRVDSWDEHFFWNGPAIVGRTAVGRVTVMVLAMNDELQVANREALMTAGRW